MQATCSIDLREPAVVYCACFYPLPALCGACINKHCLTPAFHFLLSPAAKETITSAREQLKVQPWLFQLCNSYRELELAITEISRCEERVESVYQEILQSALELKTSYQARLTSLKRQYQEALNQAIQDTSLHAHERTVYIPIAPMSRLIWFHDANRPEELEIFKFHGKCDDRFVAKAFQVGFSTSISGLEQFDIGEIPRTIDLAVLMEDESDVLQLGLKSDMLISDLNKKIQEEKRLPIGLYRITMDGKELDVWKTLAECKITPESKLKFEAKIYEISIKTLTGETLPMNVEKTDSVSSLKTRIEKQLGIMKDEQSLMFSGRLLEDFQLLDYYDIKNQSVIHLVPMFLKGFNIFIKLPENRTICIGVETADSIKMLKGKILSKTGIKEDRQILRYQGVVLEDAKKVADYKLQKESSIDLRMPRDFL